MLDKKYFHPIAYIKKLKYLIAKLLLTSGISIRVITRIDDHRITFLTNSYLEYLLRAQKSYEREKVTMYWLRQVIDSSDVIYDVGANVGAYSLFAGHKVKSGGGRVYSFEPAFFNFFSLSRNIQANNLIGTVIPYPVALGEVAGESKFFLSSTMAGSALHGLGCAESEGKTFETQFIQGAYVISLDEFCFQPKVDFPNHIKIDVDGSEYKILLGMQSVMSDERLKSIMIEINCDISQGKLEEKIGSFGFEEERIEQWPGKNIYNKLFLRH